MTSERRRAGPADASNGSGISLARYLVLASLCLLTTGLAGVSGAEVGEPPYDFPYRNGLYGTVAGTLVLDRAKIEVPGLRPLKLTVPGMQKQLSALGVVQKAQAPVVLCLQGIGGKADTNSGKIWMKWFAEAGFHVLAFDSTFAPTFVSASRHGVSGNMRMEASLSVEALNAFLQLPELQGKVGSIGVVGMSYGAIQSLTIGRLAKEGRVPFRISAIQAYSPPVNMATTGGIIDKWYSEDRWNYKLSQMAAEFLKHKPVERDEEIPFSDSLLRAVIAALFRISLAETIERNDSVYRLKLLPEENRLDYAETWGFQKFMGSMVIPYWAPRLKLADPVELIRSLDLETLMRDQAPTTEVIEAVDDPFNDPAELAALRQQRFPCRLTVLPCGGHLGYIMHPWIRHHLLRLFEVVAAPEPTVVKAAPDVRPVLKPKVPQVAAAATGAEERHSAVALFAGAFRCGDKALVEQALEEAARHPDYLFGTIGWPDLVAEIASRSGAEIQPLLIGYLARNVRRLNPADLGRIAKHLPGIDLATYLGELRIDAWNTQASGVEDATRALAEAVQAGDFATARAYARLIEKKGRLKLLAAVATVLDTEDRELSEAALAAFKAHAEALEAVVDSPLRCLVWWRVSGREKLDELLRNEP